MGEKATAGAVARLWRRKTGQAAAGSGLPKHVTRSREYQRRPIAKQAGAKMFRKRGVQLMQEQRIVINIRVGTEVLKTPIQQDRRLD
jgi:hypothetical protein